MNLSGKKSCNGPGSDPYRNRVFNGRCNCKRNVKGKFCSECKRNSFDLSATHQKGCLRCFCSDMSTTCESSNWSREWLHLTFTNDSQNVELVYKNLSSVQLYHYIDLEEELVYVDNLPMKSNETYYWKLPEAFLGEKLTSYGGYLNFNIKYDLHPISQEEKKWLKEPLVVMIGNGVTVYYRFRKRNRRIESHFLPLVEQSWYKIRQTSAPELTLTKLGDRKTLWKKGRKRRRAKRVELMKLLSNVEFILVKANYRANVKKVSLLLMAMSHAVPNGTDSAERATEVESCTCPEGYEGLSCQYCSSGYTRNSTSSSLKRGAPHQCFPCHCNGHSNRCERESGKCLDCKHNTGGDQCQHSFLECDQRGTFEHEISPAIPSRCVCKARAQGELCDNCKIGYFHLDMENEKGCTKCWCSGVTFKCSSSSLRRFQIRIQPPAFINMGFFDGRKTRLWAIKVNSGKATFYFRKYKNFNNFHWSLPKKFTGNLLRSYGGHLNFSLYSHGICEERRRMNPFVELESFAGEVVSWKFKPTAIINALVLFSVKLTEDNFVYYGMNSERSMFLRILSSLKSLRVHVPDCRGLKSTEINNVVLDTAVSWASEHPFALEVEECQCPEEYSGLSCENCSPGYVKDDLGKRCLRKATYS